jgi:hypothetical protein
MARSLTPGLARDLRTAVIAVAVTLLLAATPSVAAKIKNADKVDGKHAVAAKASPSKRAGKMVATDRSGHLPADLIPKALDADRLDGLDSTGFRARTAAPGELMTGVFAIVTTAYLGVTAVNFPSSLPAALSHTRSTVVPPGGTTSACPGVGQVAVNGWLCIHEAGAQKVTSVSIFDPATTTSGINRDGFELSVSCDPGTCILEGTYAVRAP